MKVLYVGDSETVISRYCVGADVFEQSYFNDNGRYLREAMHGQPDIELRHIIPAGVPNEFPTTDDELAAYDAVIFSDVGYNSMIFYPGLTPPYSYPLGPDRCQMVADLVARYRDDPMIATGAFGRGRTAIFASDFAPHWAGDFPRWDGYATFWTQMLGWLAGNRSLDNRVV